MNEDLKKGKENNKQTGVNLLIEKLYQILVSRQNIYNYNLLDQNIEETEQRRNIDQKGKPSFMYFGFFFLLFIY